MANLNQKSCLQYFKITINLCLISSIKWYLLNSKNKSHLKKYHQNQKN